MLAISGVALPHRAAAQESESNLNLDAESAADDLDIWSGVEEILVTGDMMPVLGLDDTVSVTTFDAATLEALGIEDISDLAAMTPNLSINTISASTPTFFIRGVGLNDFASNATGAVAVYQDGVPISSPALQLGQLFDSSVEVFRGPQTFGNERNSSAGLIAASPRLPTGEFEAKLRMDLGRYNLQDFEGALSAPVSSDGTLSTRVSFRYTVRDPYVRNRCGGLAVPTQDACGANTSPRSDPVPAGLPKKIGDQERWAVRGLLRYQPANTDMDWILNIHGSSIDQQSVLGQVIGTRFPRVQTVSGYVDPAVKKIFDNHQQNLRDQGLTAVQARRAAYLPTLSDVTKEIKRADPLNGAYDMVGQEKLDAVGGSLRGRLSIADIEIETISGVESYDRLRRTDFDFSPNSMLNSDTDDRAWQATQSLDLNGELERLALSWNAGGFFLKESLDSKSDFLFNFTQDVSLPRAIRQTYSQDNYSCGVFGNR